MMTSNLAVRRATFPLIPGIEVEREKRLTGVEQGNGIIDGLFGMCLEDLFHVWEGR